MLTHPITPEPRPDTPDEPKGFSKPEIAIAVGVVMMIIGAIWTQVVANHNVLVTDYSDATYQSILDPILFAAVGFWITFFGVLFLVIRAAIKAARS